MASQQTRSAFMLITIALFQCVVFQSLFFQWATTTTVTASAIFNNNINIANQHQNYNDEATVVLPKFGDRISPRNRSFIDVEKLRTSSNLNNNNNNINNNANFNIDNNSNLYNGVSSGSGSGANAGDSTQSGNFNKNTSKEVLQYSGSSTSSSSSNGGNNNLNNNGAIRNKHKRLPTSLHYSSDSYYDDSNDDGDDDAASIEIDVIDDGSEDGVLLQHQRQQRQQRHNLNNNYYKNTSSNSAIDNVSVGEEASNDGDSGDSSDDGHRLMGRTADLKMPSIGNDIDIRDGNASSAQAHRLEMSTEFFVVPSTFPSIVKSTAATTHHLPGGIILPNRASLNKNTASIVPPLSHSHNRMGNVSQPSIASVHNPLGLRKDPWVVPVLVLTSLVMLMMAAFEIFVLCKAWQTSPSRRHLFLGQMLLLGLFLCAGLAAILTTSPTILSCGIVRFGAGVAFALVFASLLVKCVFLISLNSGVYLPAPYQGLLLLFAVLIQVAVGGQWLLTTPAAVEEVSVPIRNGPISLTHHSLLLTAQDITMTTTIPLCKTQFPELLYSLVYVIFLIFFVAILAIKSRRIRENYREATYIGLAIGGSIPIWLGWTLCGLAVTERHKDACLAFGLVATSATVFLVMFMPKGRQLAAMGKEGLYIEDRDEQFSSLSRTGSGYSPSFFHFKPIKYGVMGNTLASTNTNTANTTSKHQAVASLGNGLFIRPTDEANLYTTLEPTMSSNPNVYFQRGGNVHPGMMY